ncbi:MAG: ArsC family transcriptional regulator [Robiginitomaculum sp.]|nr:MAG: ArsC family transcriptional regulator [Robiginitomaculum sp.]
MSLTFYGLKTCDTCRKAQKELIAAGHDITVVDVRADGVSADKLSEWATKVEWKKLFNTRSTTWRNLDAADKEDLDQAKAIALMVTYPTLIKRPVIENGDSVTVGWTKDVKALLL